MKKIIALVVLTAFSISLVGCGNASKSEEKEEAPVKTSLAYVEVTFPADIFEGETDAEIIEDAEKEGYKKCTINDDGSVTYKMTKKQRNEQLKELTVAFDETVDELINPKPADENGSSYEEQLETSITAVKHNKDFSKIDIYVDGELSFGDALYIFAFAYVANEYQLLSGVAQEDFDSTISTYDSETKELINSESAKEIIEDDTDSDAEVEDYAE